MTFPAVIHSLWLVGLGLEWEAEETKINYVSFLPSWDNSGYNWFCLMLRSILEIVYVYNWSHSTAPHNEAELKFAGTLDIPISKANKSVMRFALHGISAWWWTFSESTYSYDNVPAQEICYTVASEKGRAFLPHHRCSITIHNFRVSFPKGEKQYFFL